jgi:hypothetical protein
LEDAGAEAAEALAKAFGIALDSSPDVLLRVTSREYRPPRCCRRSNKIQCWRVALWCAVQESWSGHAYGAAVLAQRTVAFASLIAFEPMGDGQCHRVWVICLLKSTTSLGARATGPKSVAHTCVRKTLSLRRTALLKQKSTRDLAWGSATLDMTVIPVTAPTSIRTKNAGAE